MPRGEIVPEPWASAMEKVGAVSNRSGLASMNELSRLSGVSTATVQRLCYGRVGTRGAEKETIDKLADALRVKPKVVAGWVGAAWEDSAKQWVPPAGVNSLSVRQQKALNELIRSMIAEKNQTGPIGSQ